jgi:hypothetical protein
MLEISFSNQAETESDHSEFDRDRVGAGILPREEESIGFYVPSHLRLSA